MSTDNVEIIPDKQLHLLDDLQSLLERQIELAHQGNISDVELLSERASSVTEKIARAGILEAAELKNRREHLQKLYKDLCLAIASQKADITDKLSRVRRGKKTIGIYRGSIR